MSCGGVAFLLIRLVASRGASETVQVPNARRTTIKLSIISVSVRGEPSPAVTRPLKSILMIPTTYRRLTGDLPTCILADLIHAIGQTPTAANGRPHFGAYEAMPFGAHLH